MENCLESMILHGCNLAKILEHNLPNLANQPDILVKSCEEIVSVFRNVRETVLLSVGQMGVQELHGLGIGGGIREHAMASLDARAISGVGTAHIRRVDDVPESGEMKGMPLHDQRRQRQLCLEFMMFGEMSGVGGDIMGGSSGGIGGQTPLDFSSASSSQTHGRRKNEVDKVVKKVAAPQMGNNETPPEDGFKWKKYGQKEILGHAYPRSYYICTQQKLRHCPAKKQVQRLDNEPFVFEVTYRNNHICRVPSASDAAPVLLPPSTTGQSPPLPPFPTSLMATTQFLSTNIFRHLGGVPASSGGVEAGSSGGRGKFNEFQQVADMADAMFNSGISRSNSMDLIFSSLDDHKWDYGRS
ncbi:WRKY transcription factor 55-like [Primulina eburnea]|uniref:WRKY transcription factor 55-like n=1 Tax=Primulina eburnea TaxID=1245227 RepID=UPI003C6C8893